MKGVQKCTFDPFRRRDRIEFRYNPNSPSDYIETTIGQLNFFRWIIKYNILNYVCKNFEKINEAMINYMKKKNEEKARKRKELQKQKKDWENALVPSKKKKDRLTISQRHTKRIQEIVVTFE